MGMMRRTITVFRHQVRMVRRMRKTWRMRRMRKMRKTWRMRRSRKTGTRMKMTRRTRKMRYQWRRPQPSHHPLTPKEKELWRLKEKAKHHHRNARPLCRNQNQNHTLLVRG
ncbi:Hypothetical predicted protein [Prunus dulcis]|uniref:Uncharacterized protein n=1 Tax=Prunus dulcis TaxID=3755 RepID=A0A5E4GIR8_PRUDU|nr:Hypothetical predicted protein [Prunus dulcis]